MKKAGNELPPGALASAAGINAAVKPKVPWRKERIRPASVLASTTWS
jgi:hypothetical protein